LIQVLYIVDSSSAQVKSKTWYIGISWFSANAIKTQLNVLFLRTSSRRNVVWSRCDIAVKLLNNNHSLTQLPKNIGR